MIIKKIKIPKFKSEDGMLSIIEGNNILPFNIKRVFFVNAKKNIIRGNHAHKKCTQFFLCLNKTIEVKFDDGTQKRKVLLQNNQIGVLVPPKIWSSQVYLDNDSIMAVFCNLKFDEKEYLRNYSDFLKFIRL